MDPIVDEVARAIERVDVEALRRTYVEQDEFVYIERWLPPALVARLVADVDRVRPAIHRNYIPRHKKGGSVSAYTLVAQAPAIVALYRSPAFLEFLARLTGARLQRCPATDPHACALYFYTEPGDHIGFHYDTSYYRSARYTVLVGLVERSSSRLVCQLHRGLPGRTPVEVSLRTD
ncbi:MAG: 2OG-Fe(II) oxygenase, partial [Candidatus Rokubacteria bacterium RBG_16_73_20]